MLVGWLTHPGLQFAVHFVFTAMVPLEHPIQAWTLAVAGGARQAAVAIATPQSRSNALMGNITFEMPFVGWGFKTSDSNVTL